MTKSSDPAGMGRVTPILRMFDEEKTKQFYLEFLEFNMDWEHRFDESAPLYMQVSSGQCALHLSEHFGDGSPGAAIRIEMAGIEAYHAKLLDKRYKHARPGLEKTPWNTAECSIQDPAGNRIIFYENL